MKKIAIVSEDIRKSNLYLEELAGEMKLKDIDEFAVVGGAWTLKLKNGDVMRVFPPVAFAFLGMRFDEALVASSVDANFVEECILPTLRSESGEQKISYW